MTAIDKDDAGQVVYDLPFSTPDATLPPMDPAAQICRSPRFTICGLDQANRLVVRIADDLLQRDGRMIAALGLIRAGSNRPWAALHSR